MDTNILFIIADAIKAESLEDLLNQGELKSLKTNLVDRGVYIKNCITSFPSVSLSSHTTILTGVLPYRHSIPAHKWYNRQNKQIRSYIGLYGFNIIKDLARDEKTIFEHFNNKKGICIFEPVHRGAKKYIPVYGNNNSLGIDTLLKEFTAENCYKVGVLWLPEMDSLIHLKGTSQNIIHKGLKKLDSDLGKLFESLKKNNMYDNTLLVFVSDHGCRDVNYHINIETILSKHKIKVLNRFYQRYLPKSIIKNYDVVSCCNGNGTAFLYVKKPQEINIIKDILLKQKEISHIFMRKSHEEYEIFSNHGYARVKTKNNNGNFKHNLYGYEIIDNDPLFEEARNGNKYYTQEQWLQKTYNGNYPDIIPQITMTFKFQHHCDIIVMPQKDCDFSAGKRIAWNLGDHKGTHGSFYKEEMAVPAIIAGNSIYPKTIEYARTIDILPTVLYKAGIETDIDKLDGKILNTD